MTSWRDRAIEKSQAISDAWDVAKAYAGRGAEWVLFGCMIVNIVEMLPGDLVPLAIANGVLALQAITLDVAGFGLQSLADHAERNGDAKAAKRARTTGYVLITIMIVTLVSVTLPLLWPSAEIRHITEIADKVLILVRVALTVLYGHVVHGLRQYGEVREQLDLQQLRDQVNELSTNLSEQKTNMQSELFARLSELKTNIANIQSELSTNTGEHLPAELSVQLSAQMGQIQQALIAHEQALQVLPLLQRDLRHLEIETKKIREGNREMPPANVRYLRDVRTVSEKQSEKTDMPTERGTENSTEKTNNAPNEKGAFVRWCLTENPNIRNSEIQRKAAEHGMTISAGYISDIRKSLPEGETLPVAKSVNE